MYKSFLKKEIDESLYCIYEHWKCTEVKLILTPKN